MGSIILRLKRYLFIGDGGNDVSMIQAADVGLGIVGKEGKQASLAADFSVTQFSHIARLILVHGRYRLLHFKLIYAALLSLENILNVFFFFFRLIVFV